jgi:hypothetical protein
MRKITIMVVVAGWAITVGVVLHSAIKDFLWTHPWWHSFLAAVPAIALPILSYLEWRHSGEANVLRSRIANLTAERNQHLQQIAKNTEKPITQAERNAATLRKHLGACVTVSEGQGDWGNTNTPEIADVSDDNVVTLFTPRNSISATAWCIKVQCADLEITDIPQGACPLRLKVLKRYGPDVQLGGITKWEDRLQPTANPSFVKGGMAHGARYSKLGSSETRSLHVYASLGGANSFLLEASTGERITGDNEEISKRFMVLQIQYLAEGFVRSNLGTGGSSHRLFIC